MYIYLKGIGMKIHIICALLLAGVACRAGGQETDTLAPAGAPEPIAVQEKKLTMLAEDITRFIDSMPKRIDKSRVQGFGGAGGWTPCLMGVNISPVRDLLKKEPQLRDLSFGMGGRYDYFAGSGGMGYGGIGNGLRIGGGGWHLSHKYTSNLFGAAKDSIAELNVTVNYGGFLFEKALVRGKMNYVAGGMFGGGSYDVTRRFYNDAEPSAFSEPGKDLSETATATFTAFEVHAGFTYTMTWWFHVGADANISAFVSVDEFGPLTDSFNTFNGGIRLRLIFGNLG